MESLWTWVYLGYNYRIGCLITRFELLHAFGYNTHQIRDFMLSFITRFGLLRLQNWVRHVPRCLTCSAVPDYEILNKVPLFLILCHAVLKKYVQFFDSIDQIRKIVKLVWFWVIIQAFRILFPLVALIRKS